MKQVSIDNDVFWFLTVAAEVRASNLSIHQRLSNQQKRRSRGHKSYWPRKTLRRFGRTGRATSFLLAFVAESIAHFKSRNPIVDMAKLLGLCKPGLSHI